MKMFVLLVVFVSVWANGVLASSATWETLRLGTNPNQDDVSRYLVAMRELLNERPIGKSRPENWRPPPIEKSFLDKARAALDAVPIESLDHILKACVKAERDWTNETIDVYVQLPEGTKTLVGYDEARTRFRSPFTQVALNYVAHVANVPPQHHKTYFEYLSDFPELIVGVSRRTWVQEMDPYLTRKLLDRIDRTTGWRGVSRLWIACLVRMDTERSWQGLEHLVIGAQMSVRLEAYEAMKESPNRRINLDDCVSKAWKTYVKESVHGNRASFASIAASHGVTDAVVELAEFVLKHWAQKPPEKASASLVSVVGPTFPNANEAADWVVKNRRSLSFDAQFRRFNSPQRPNPESRVPGSRHNDSR